MCLLFVGILNIAAVLLASEQCYLYPAETFISVTPFRLEQLQSTDYLNKKKKVNHTINLTA